MLWKTHLRITFEVFRRLGIPLSRAEEERLKEGVLGPDKWGDYPHHYGKELQIKDNLLLSRKYFLQDDFLNAYYYLGVALHYIQDSYTSMASFYHKHHSWEESIEDCGYVPNMEEAIHYWLRNNHFERIRCLGLSSALSNEVKDKDNTLYIATLTGHERRRTFAKPIIDFNLAFRASYLVTKSALCPRNNPQIDLALEQSLAYHENLLHDAELAVSKQIIETAKQIENLKNKRISKSGLVPSLKNWLLRLRVEIREMQLNSRYKWYVQKKHLLEINAKYRTATDIIIGPHVGWYNFLIPQLNIDNVKSELVPIQELEYLVNSEASYLILGDQKVICRREQVNY